MRGGTCTFERVRVPVRPTGADPADGTSSGSFGSVTVLNGHIHQVMQKVEGNVTFHTAMSTAFPQSAPGTAKGPGPMKVSDDKLRSVLGITNVQSVMKRHSLAVVDSTLDPAS